ncbi:Hypothetical predicted protein, partial [Pelobates cultripes]
LTITKLTYPKDKHGTYQNPRGNRLYDRVDWGCHGPRRQQHVTTWCLARRR